MVKKLTKIDKVLFMNAQRWCAVVLETRNPAAIVAAGLVSFTVEGQISPWLSAPCRARA
jgi:hypothetical protein